MNGTNLTIKQLNSSMQPKKRYTVDTLAFATDTIARMQAYLVHVFMRCVESVA